MKKGQFGLILSLSLVVAGCGQQTATPGPTQMAQAHAAVFTDAQTLPVAVGQAMAVKNGILTGKLTPQNVDQTSVATTLIEDFDGQPFYYLTLTTQGLGENPTFWDAVNSVTDSRQDTLAATGASTARTLYAFEYGASVTRALKATAQKAGSVQRLIIPDGGVLWLQDKQGRYWSVLEGQLISDETVQAARLTYDRLVQRYAQDPESMQEIWDSVLADPTLAPSNPETGVGTQSTTNVSLSRFVRADGTLNVQRLIHSLPAEALKSQMTDTDEGLKPLWTSDTNDEADWGFLNRVKSRANIAGSSLPGWTAINTDPSTNAEWLALKKTDFGNRQRAFGDMNHTLEAGQAWGMRSAFSPVSSLPPANWDTVGCMAMGYVRLVATLAQKNTLFKNGLISQNVFSANDPAAVQIQKTAAWLTKPVQADGMPTNTMEAYITQRMGGGYFKGGTLITPPGLVNGGISILNEKLLAVPGAASAGVRFDGWGWTDPTGNGGVAAGSNPVTYWGKTPSTFPVDGAGFNAGTIWARDMVRRTMRDSDLPVLFLYSTGGDGGLGGHAAVSGAYRSYEYAGGYSDVFLYTAENTSPNDATKSLYPNATNNFPGYGEGVDGPTGWINVTNRWSAYGGVYAVGTQWNW